MRLRPLLGDEGADTGDPDQQAVGGELAQGAIGRHARNIELTYQLVLRGHTVAHRQRPRGNPREDELLDLQVAGGSRRGGHVEARGAALYCGYPAIGSIRLSIQV